MHWRRQWQPTPVFLPGESQGRGAWWAAIYGVAQSRIRLKQLSSSSWFVTAFLPRGKHLLILWLQSLSSVILEPKKINLSLLISASWDVVIPPCLKDFGSQDCPPQPPLLFSFASASRSSNLQLLPCTFSGRFNSKLKHPQLQRAHSNFSEKSPCGDRGSTLKPPSLLCLSGTPPHIAHSSFPSSVSEQFLCSQSGQGLSLVLLWPSFLKNLNGSLFPTSFWYLKPVAFGSTLSYVSILLDTNISCVVIALRQYKEEQEDGFCNIGPIKLQKHNFKERHRGSDSSLVTQVCITEILCGDHELTAW